MIIQRYLFREVLHTFTAVLAVLMLIYASNLFVRFLADAAAGAIPSDVVLELIALKLVGNLELLLPLSLYLAVLLALGRLYKDSEIIAMTAGGVGTGRLARAILVMLLGFGAVCAGLSLYVSPEAAVLKEEIYARARNESQITGVFPGRFKEYSGGDQIVYVEKLSRDRLRMRNVFVQVRTGEQVELVVAESGYQAVDGDTGDRYIVLENGYRYAGNPGAADYVVTRFDKHGVRLAEAAEVNRYRKMEAVPTPLLLVSDRADFQAELQWRLSLPVSLVLLGMLAVPLARTSPRQGRYAKLFTAVLAYFVYNNTLGMAQTLIERETLSVTVGVWPVHLAMLAAVAFLIFSHAYGRSPVGWVRQRLRARR